MPRALLIIMAILSLGTTAMAQGDGYRNAVKITFLSWATGSTKLSYERALPHRQSAELCASIIGAGYDKYGNNPRGYTLRYGHKFFLAGSKGGPLSGLFLRPEIIYSRYRYTPSDGGTRRLAAMGTLLATAGYQRCWGHFIADGWVGIGPAAGIPAETGYHHGFQLWKWLGIRDNNLALSFSIRIGYCF